MNRDGKSGFTLMEFLVVIGVIAILIGLLFPALMSALERARVTRARTEILSLQQAWQAYWETYGEFPSVSDMRASTVAILGGADTSENRNGIAFMEFDTRHYLEGFLDPWGRPYQLDLGVEPTPVETTWAYQTRAHCVMSARDQL